MITEKIILETLNNVKTTLSEKYEDIAKIEINLYDGVLIDTNQYLLDNKINIDTMQDMLNFKSEVYDFDGYLNNFDIDKELAKYVLIFLCEVGSYLFRIKMMSKGFKYKGSLYEATANIQEAVVSELKLRNIHEDVYIIPGTASINASIITHSAISFMYMAFPYTLPIFYKYKK